MNCYSMCLKQVLLILTGVYLVLGAFPDCPNRTATVVQGPGGPGGSRPLKPPSSCESLSGECIDVRCKDCQPGELSDGLCESNLGQYRRCCKECALIPTCKVETAGYFTTYYGKRFNFQRVGTYLLSEDCKGDGLWSVQITLTHYTDKESALDRVTVTVDNVVVTFDHTAEEFKVSKDGETVNGTTNPFTVGKVTTLTLPGKVVLEFLGVKVTDILASRSVHVSPSYEYTNKTCGLCGVISDVPLDFTTDKTQLSIKNLTDPVHEGCPVYGKPDYVAKCKILLSEVGPCTVKVPFTAYVQACALTACLTNEETSQAFNVKQDYAYHCFPRTQGTCTMSGHTFYDTFDDATFQFQATGIPGTTEFPCPIVLAQDCEGREFVIEAFTRNTSSYTEIEKIRLSRGAKEIEFVVFGKKVIVDGQTVDFDALPINESPFTIYTQDEGGIVTVAGLNGDVTVHFNFDQLVVIKVASKYRGKTCGICGDFNGDASNDKITVPESCVTLPNPPDCTTDQVAEARKFCKDLFEEDIDHDCYICYKPDRIKRCMYEYCLRGRQGLCDNSKEFSDECYLKGGNNLPNLENCTGAERVK